MNSHMIIRTWKCKIPVPKYYIRRLKTRAGIGMVVDVIGPSLNCTCCVSVIPTWEQIEDQRGHTCRRENLLKITPDEAILTEQNEEVAA